MRYRKKERETESAIDRKVYCEVIQYAAIALFRI